MNSKNTDHSTYREWLYLELDGALNPLQRKDLRDHLAVCLECRHEQRELIALDEMLIASRITVRSDFTEDVMSALPPAAWQARSPRSWRAAIAVLVALLFGAGALVTTAGQGLSSISTLATLLATVADLFRSSIVVGAGLLGASWKGLGLAMQQILSGSIWNLLAVGALVLAVNLLLIGLLRRRYRFAREGHRSGRRK